ncbi:hypothetical protein KR009_008580, partial [Drosophila setifemur]
VVIGGGRGYSGIELREMHHFTYVSICVKYMIFLLNFIFWLFGGLLLGIGIYAFKDKWEEANGWVRLESIYDFIFNISLVMIFAGMTIFVVSFSGCLGALRENTFLLKFYSMCLLLFFLMEMTVGESSRCPRACFQAPNANFHGNFLSPTAAIICFVFPQYMNTFLEKQFTDKIIHSYREDPDLQNFIDFAQQEFKCCGLSNAGYQDWSKNEYFNCSSPSVEKCGVPYSCCINATDISSGLVNIMCGYNVQGAPVPEARKRIWTSGCIEIVRVWAERNLYVIAGIALGIALIQLLVIYLAKTLEGQIELQKSRWSA